MNNLIKIIAICFTYLFLINCEEIDVVELEIDYKAKIVVQAELIANEFFDGIYISKTLPLNEQYNDKETEISDANFFLIVDSIKIIPLHYKGFGKYGSFSEFKIRSNETYELFGLVDGNEIYSKTLIPRPPTLSSNRFVADGYLSALVKSNGDEVYGAIWLMSNDAFTKPFDKAEDFYSIVPASSYEDKLVRTINLDPEYLSSFYSDKIFLQVFAFDNSYYNYFFTKNNNNPVEDNFSQGGGPIHWNVKGDNVIGMFIGMSKTDFINVIP